MASGGARARSGPAPDPNSYRSLNKDWVELPADGFDGGAPDWPLSDGGDLDSVEQSLWEALWTKPQAAAWSALGLEYQVAAYVRAYVASTDGDSRSAGLTTAVLRMETELGISVAGMRQNGWRIGDGSAAATVPSAPAAARRTSTGSWLKGVSVEGA